MANHLCLLCLQAFDNDDDDDDTTTAKLQNAFQIKLLCELLAPRQSNNHKDLVPYQFGEDEVCEFCPDCYPLVGTVEEIRNQIALLEEQMVVKIREIRATLLESSSSSSLRNEREEQIVEIRDKIIRVTGEGDEEDDDLADEVKEEIKEEDEIKEEFEEFKEEFEEEDDEEEEFKEEDDEEKEFKEEVEAFEEEEEIKEEFEDFEEEVEDVEESEEEEEEGAVDPLGDIDDYHVDTIDDQETDPLKEEDEEEDDCFIIPSPQEKPREQSKLATNNPPPRPSILRPKRKLEESPPPPANQGRRKQNFTLIVQDTYRPPPPPVKQCPPPPKNSRRATRPQPAVSSRSRKSPLVSNFHVDDNIYWGQITDSSSSSPVEQSRTTTWTPQPHKCPSCDLSFTSASSLHSHLNQNHRGRITCRAPSCTAKFSTPFAMEVHWQKTHQITSTQKHPGSLACRLCGRKLRKSRLVIHMVVQHENGEKKFPCLKCGKSFCLLENYHRHVNLHKFDTTKPFVCDLCDLRFYDAASLEHHKTTHVKKPNKFKCEECGKMVANRQTLARHMRCHTREKTEKCPHCEKTYLDKITLKRHVAVSHSTTGPTNMCHLCGKAFYLPSDVRHHIERRHEGKHQIKCDQCDETFRQTSTLQAHKVKVHGHDPYPCDECSATFSSEHGVRHHKVIHRGIKNHSCETCGASFYFKYDLVGHMTTHTKARPHLCSHCGKAFKMKEHLKIHIRGVHTPGYVAPTPHKCPHCEKSFRAPFFLKGHIRQVHTGERPFTCDQCGKGFAVKQALNLHLTGAHGIAVERTKKDRGPRSKRDDFQEKEKGDA